MRKFRALALLGLSVSGVIASTAAFATSVYYPVCYWALVLTNYGWQLQEVCY